MSRGPRWQRDSLDLVKLAWPIIINRLGIMTLSVVDTVMVARYSSVELAYLGVGLVPSNIAILILVGLILGVQVLVSQNFGAKNYEKCGEIWWRAMPYAFFLGCLGLGICLFTEEILLFTGQEPAIAKGGGQIAIIAGLSLPILGVYMVTTMFLEGIRKVKPAMIIIIVANIINIFANYALIYGAMGMPELGAVGSAWASTIVRSIQLLVVLGFVWFLKDLERFALHKIPKLSIRAGQEMRRIGYAAGLSLGFENFSFNALAVLAGLLGATTLAAHVITANIFGLAFMAGLGFSAATSVRVGNAHGAGHWGSAMYAGWLGLSVQSIFTLFVTIFVYLNAEWIIRFYSNDANVVPLATQLLSYLALLLVIDAGQSLLSNAIRARDYSWSPTIIHFFCYALLMIPASYFAIYNLERGAMGLIDGAIASTILSLALSLTVFYYIGYQDKFRPMRS